MTTDTEIANQCTYQMTERKIASIVTPTFVRTYRQIKNLNLQNLTIHENN